MQPLKEVNVQKCLEILEDFHEIVPVDDSNQELIEKKAEARHSLDRLANLFGGEDVEHQRAQCDENHPR